MDSRLWPALADTPNDILFHVWIDLRWEEGTQRLFARKIGFGRSFIKGSPQRIFNHVISFPNVELIGNLTSEKDIEAIKELRKNGFNIDTILLNRKWGSWEEMRGGYLDNWLSLLRTIPETSLRAKEFLKVLNLKVYGFLDTELRKLSQWEFEDGRLYEVYEAQRKDMLDSDNDTIKPFFIRETKRDAYRAGKEAIEEWLLTHGIDVEIAILSMGQSQILSDVSATQEATSDQNDKAIEWGAEEYIRRHRPKTIRGVRKDRPTASEAVKMYFATLRGLKRKNKIDSMRGRIFTRVKNKLRDQKKRKD